MLSMHEIESFSVRRIEDLVASTLMASGRALTPAASGAALSSSSTNMTEGQAVQGGWGVPTGLRFQPVAIEATGRDPLKSKLAGDCYTTHDGCGVTTRACSGVLVCGASGGAAVVIAPIFAIAPFLRELPRMASDPLLIADTRIRVGIPSGADLEWAPAELVSLTEIPELREFASSMLEHAALARCRGVCLFSTVCTLRVTSLPTLPAGAPGCTDCPALGASLTLTSCPFGDVCPSLFSRCVASGICCAVASSRSLLLTDVRALPGSQGGLVTDATGACVGMLLPPVTEALSTDCSALRPPPQHKLSGLSCVITLRSLLARTCASIPPLLPTRLLAAAHTPTASQVLASRPHPRIAIVRDSSSWGTAVCMNDDGSVFVTCAHCVGKDKRVRLGFPATGAGLPRVQWRDAEVLCVGNSALDVAVLALAGAPRSPRLCGAVREGLTACVRDGARVECVGYGGLPPWSSPLVSPVHCSGVVSKAVTENDGELPILYHTTVPIWPGHSGGPVFTCVQGRVRLIGIITSLLTLKSSHPAAAEALTIWRDASYVLPIARIAPSVSAALSGGDTAAVVNGLCTPKFVEMWNGTGAPTGLSKL